MIRYYDDKNDRYLIPDATGCDPKTTWCVQLEYDEDADDYLPTDLVLFRNSDLNKMIKEEVI